MNAPEQIVIEQPYHEVNGKLMGLSDVWLHPVDDALEISRADAAIYEYTRSDLIPAMIAEAVARERADCADLADDIHDPYDEGTQGADIVARAIRARGQS